MPDEPQENVTISKADLSDLLDAKLAERDAKTQTQMTQVLDAVRSRPPTTPAAQVEAGPPKPHVTGQIITALDASKSGAGVVPVQNYAASFNYRDFLNASKPFAQELNLLCIRYGYSQLKAFLQICQESGWNPNAVSEAGAIGLCQIMPETAAGWSVNPHDPGDSMRGMVSNMKGYLETYTRALGQHNPAPGREVHDQAFRLALAAYNAGPRSVESHDLNVPPFAETQRYVAAIFGTESVILNNDAHRLRWVEDWNTVLRG